MAMEVCAKDAGTVPASFAPIFNAREAKAHQCETNPAALSAADLRQLAAAPALSHAPERRCGTAGAVLWAVCCAPYPQSRPALHGGGGGASLCSCSAGC